MATEKTAGERMLYGEREAAKLLGVGVGTLWNERKAGRLRWTRIGRVGVRYSREQLAAWVKSRECGAESGKE